MWIFFHYLFSFSSFHGPSVSVFFRSFIPLIIHSAKFAPLLSSSCNVIFWLSCLLLSPYPSSRVSFFWWLPINFSFSTPLNSFNLWIETLASSIIHNNFFLGLGTATPFYFYTLLFLPFCILLPSIRFNNCSITVHSAM